MLCMGCDTLSSMISNGTVLSGRRLPTLARDPLLGSHDRMTDGCFRNGEGYEE